MSFAAILCLVLTAVYGLTSLLISILVAVAWRAGLDRRCSTSIEFLVLRLLPAGGATLFTLTVALPAFLIYEPAHEIEQIGELIVTFAIFGLVSVGGGIFRGLRACQAAQTLLRNWGPGDRWFAKDGQTVELMDIPEPIAAVVGGWQPRIVAARRVFGVCSQEEFRQVVGHEVAHVSARDNLKLLLLLGSPDALAWLPSGVALTARWQAAAELEADERATGSDPRKRVALASALIKVARLAKGADRSLPALSMPVALNDVEERVRLLLSPSQNPTPAMSVNQLTASATLVPVIAVPFYGLIHQVIEFLVAFGR
ncbi:MAG: hypothetical protein NVS1B6_01330 [Steroidobacteraceae bacterium]